EPGSRFTLLFEAFAVQVLQASASLTQAAELLRLDWDSVQPIMDRSVTRGLALRSTDAVTRVALDEKSFGRRICCGSNWVCRICAIPQGGGGSLCSSTARAARCRHPSFSSH
ncbi:MAG: transposase family protein, partial [Akkermansiaceae bacterium]|nr:transposase family protein [Verrucomicrobiales bacterium]